VFELKPSKIAGCFELQSKAFEGARGRFVKVFHEQAFAAQGLNMTCQMLPHSYNTKAA